LPSLVATGTRLISNFGSAHPMAAGERLLDIARELELAIDVAVVSGDDVLDRIDPSAPSWEDGEPLESHGEIVSAHAYIGAESLLPALATGAQVVVAGRVADPSLSLAPLMHEFGWDPQDWEAMARGTAVGHLLECAGQLTGGYFADPPRNPVPDLAQLGFPIAEVTKDGNATYTKLPGTGGRVDFHTVVEQLTYEVTDPAAYLTPDVELDLTEMQVAEVGQDRVTVSGAVGRQRPESLKVSVGFRAGYRSEAEMSYAGPNALERARLAGDIIRQRLGRRVPNLRIDLIGSSAIHGLVMSAGPAPYECRLRVAALDTSAESAETVGDEVSALYTNGPAGGGGLRVRVDELIGVLSTSVPRDAVKTVVSYLSDK
jgi:hypothetical protein